MAMHRKSFKIILLSVLLGIVVGTLVGEVLGMVLPEGVPRDVLTYSKSLVLDPFTLDLMVLSITFGGSLSFNVMSLLGIFVMIQILKWTW